MHWVFAFIIGYLLGSVPFGLLLAKAAGKGDIRQIGSGNIGATNVLRAGSKGLAAAVLLLDLLKGFLAVFLAWQIFGHDNTFWSFVSSAALGAIVGHCFPVWLRFKGGKGVATAAGVCLGLWWPLGLVFAIVWLGVLAVSRISSVGGMSAALAAPVAAAITGRWDWVAVLTMIALLVLFQHRANIGRLIRGEEPKVGSKS